MKRVTLALAVLALIAAGCASATRNPASNKAVAVLPNPAPAADDDFDLLEDELEEQAIEISDPLEPINRAVFRFNDKFYFWILKPCAKACKDVIPRPVRAGVRNFFHNLTTPARYVNCFLQGRPGAAGRELHRLALNTTVGVLGFGDPALDKWGIEPAEEDLGQTLGKHGVGNGIYIVLPLLGPSSARDGAGLIADQFLNPLRYVEPPEVSYGISMGKIVNEYSFQLGEYESFKEAALDPYVAMKQAYIQYRQKQIEE